MSQDFEQEFTGIGCASVEDVELPSAGGSFFNPAEGVHKIRFLQGPVLSYVSQQWDNGQPVGDKIKYKYDDPLAKKDSDARLVMTFLIWNYKEEKIQIWEITQKGVLEDIKSINGIQPDLSAFDVQITKAKKANGFMDYKIAQGPNKPFDNKEAIAEVIEKGLNKRLAEMDKDGNASDEQTAIETQIEAAKETPLAKAARLQKIADREAEEDAKAKADAEEAFR